MKTTRCVQCNTDINNKGLWQHLRACSGNAPKKPFVKMVNCPYCGESLDSFVMANRANHVRWCHHNPMRSTYAKINDGSQMRTASAVAKRTQSIMQAYANGKYIGVNRSNSGWKQTDEAKQLIRERALASPHRRLLRSIREYIKKDGTIVKLDSSWEEALALRLDEIDVFWNRPGPFKWIDNQGVYHNYFPDFYLPEYNLYLDPKNPYAIKSQRSKLDCLKEQLPNLVIIDTLEQCKNYSPDQKNK